MVSRGASSKPRRLGDRPQDVERRPGPLRVDVVGGDRRDPAPVVDAGVEQGPEVVGEVRRGLDVHLGRQDAAGPGRWRPRNRPVGQAGDRCMAVPGLGRKFWTMTSCTWPWRAWLAAMASRASTRSARSSPMPTRIPVVKGMAELARPPPGWPAGGRASCPARPDGPPGRRAGSRSSSPGWR